MGLQPILGACGSRPETEPRAQEHSIRILVADDHGVVRHGLKPILSNRAGWTVCAEAASGLEAIAFAEQFRPDVAVVDLNMPGVDGMEAIRQIKKKFPEMGIVVLTLHYSRQLLRDLSDAGARGYVMKPDADRDLVAAVEAVAAGKTYLTAHASEGGAPRWHQAEAKLEVATDWMIASARRPVPLPRR